MSVPNTEASSRGPWVHFASLMAFLTPTSAIRRGSSTTDKGLSGGTPGWLKRDLPTEAAEKHCGSGCRGGKVTWYPEEMLTAGEWAFFLTLEFGLKLSFPHIWEVASWGLSSEVAANMLLVSLWISSAGLGTTNFILPVYKHLFWNFCKGKTCQWIWSAPSNQHIILYLCCIIWLHIRRYSFLD